MSSRIVKVRGKKESSERWLVSYADMLTLLLGLFVVLYASKQDGVVEGVVTQAVVESFSSKKSDVLSNYIDLPELVRARLSDHIKRDLVSMNVTGKYVEVVLFSKDMFLVGSADFSELIVSPLVDLGLILGEIKNRVVIEGYTDSSPINGGLYPSNWELSAARAASVLRYFEGVGILSERMNLVGFGANNPVADNNTKDGRSQNRRVVVKIIREL